MAATSGFEMASKGGDPAARQRAMALLAQADCETLAGAFDAWQPRPDWRHIRPPETGLVMTRGRAGGDGAPFNLGEVTVTRCVVALASGETGFSYCLGRDRRKAELAAIFDALWQADADAVEARLLAPLEAAQEQRDRMRRAETAATKVDFFTMVRGED